MSDWNRAPAFLVTGAGKGADMTEPAKDKDPAVMSPETREWIAGELRDDTECLEEILKRDLTAWKTVEREPEGVDP